jgi:hypothetical protein
MAALSFPASLKTRDRARMAAYKKALDFFDGKQWFGARAVPPTTRRLTINYARSFASKAAAATLKGRTNIVNADDPNADAIETYLAQVHEQNALDALDFDTELDAAVMGDGVYKVWWAVPENRVRVSAPDASGVFAWHWPDDVQRLMKVAHQYSLDADGTELALGLAPQRTNTITEVWTTELFERWHNDHLVDAGPNTLGFIPYVVFPNVRDPKKFWGTSDYAVLYEPFDELNREVTQLSTIMELSGNPIAALSGVKESTDIAVRPGAIWDLPAEARADVIDMLKSGAATQHLAYLSAIYRILHDIGETPRAAFGDTGGADLSGVALELELDPFVKKIERKRLIRRQAYRDRNEMILALSDKFAGTSFGRPNMSVAFGSVLPTDRDREVANELAMVAGNVHSARHAADALGSVDDPDAEFKRRVEELMQIPATNAPPAAPVQPNRSA